VPLRSPHKIAAQFCGVSELHPALSTVVPPALIGILHYRNYLNCRTYGTLKDCHWIYAAI
ncbi:MAG: hypothetical protein RBQ68_04600, partial [Candidatus Cloacimonadaceae bacterium]|nr:hypothetical protein [Candidatus Cloacimonadaceae bacterium]